MAEITRPDIDIQNDIQHMLRTYPPLAHDRHRVEFTVEDGVVHLSGYVKSATTFRYLLNNIDDIRGVKTVVMKGLYNDEALRLDVGRALPPGITVTMEYGAAILSGALPDGMTTEQVVAPVTRVEGIHRVRTALK